MAKGLHIVLVLALVAPAMSYFASPSSGRAHEIGADAAEAEGPRGIVIDAGHGAFSPSYAIPLNGTLANILVHNLSGIVGSINLFNPAGALLQSQAPIESKVIFTDVDITRVGTWTVADSLGMFITSFVSQKWAGVRPTAGVVTYFPNTDSYTTDLAGAFVAVIRDYDAGGLFVDGFARTAHATMGSQVNPCAPEGTAVLVRVQVVGSDTRIGLGQSTYRIVDPSPIVAENFAAVIPDVRVNALSGTHGQKMTANWIVDSTNVPYASIKGQHYVNLVENGNHVAGALGDGYTVKIEVPC
jgi:hypothetical protein